MKKNRVFLVSTAHPATDPRIVFKQCPTLAEQYEVICALPHADPTGCPGVHFIQLPYYRRVIWRVLLVAPVVLWHGLRLRPAVMQLFVPELIPVALVLKLFGTRIVYEVQENLYKKLHIKTLNRGYVLERAFRWFDQLARHYCYLIFTEHGYLDTYTKLTKPYRIIYNYPLVSFLEPFRRAYQPNQAQPAFLLIGLLSIERAFDTMVSALSRIKRHYPEATVHLFGRQTFTYAELNRMPDYETVHDNLRFYGHTDQRIAFTKITQVTAGLALLKPVGDYPDSYPTKLFEYMALGLPVVTSDFPLYRAIVDQHRCGLCVSPDDPAAIATALLYLIEHPDEAQAMGKRGRSAVELNYSWETEANKLLRFYESILIGA